MTEKIEKRKFILFMIVLYCGLLFTETRQRCSKKRKEKRKKTEGRLTVGLGPLLDFVIFF